MQTVSEVMTRNVQFVSPRETLRRAAQMMDDLNVGALPVCDGERLVGMITDRDITVRATSAGANPDETPVDTVMSTEVRWCFEDQPIDEVMRQMSDTQIRRVPVVSHDAAQRLVGIVSLGDVATKTGAGLADDDIEAVVKKVSTPSEPDRSRQGRTTASTTGSTDANPGPRMTSDVDTGAGLAGSDVLDAGMNPKYGSSTTGDPADVVEVTPKDLVNRNAPGATSLNPERLGARGRKVAEKDGVEVRRAESPPEGSATATDTDDGIDADRSQGASRAGADSTGSAGSGISP